MIHTRWWWLTLSLIRFALRWVAWLAVTIHLAAPGR